MANTVIDAYKQYVAEVKNCSVPGEEHVYHVIGDIEPFHELFAEMEKELGL